MLMRCHFQQISGFTFNFFSDRLEKKASFPFDEEFNSHKTYEVWSIAFAPNDSVVAWTCGHRYVAVLPWKRAQPKPGCSCNSVPGFCRCRNIIDVGYPTWSVAIGYMADADGLLPIGVHRQRRGCYRNGGLILAAGLENGNIRIYDLASGDLLIELLDHKDSVRDLRFSPGKCSVLLSCSRDSTLKLWDMTDQGNMFQTLRGHVPKMEVMCCSWSHNGKFVASGGTDRQLIVWSGQDWASMTRLNGHQHCVTGCEFSVDDALLASCSYDTSLVLWNYITGERLAIFWHEVPRPTTVFGFSVNNHYVRKCSFSPDCEHIATVCDDRLLRVWNIYCPDETVLSLKMDNCTSVAFSTSGSSLAVCTADGWLHIVLPMVGPRSLTALCRRTVRSFVPAEAVASLPVPESLKMFLCYDDVRSADVSP